MKRLCLFTALFIAPLLRADWSSWRGPGGNGIAPESAQPVLSWNESENILWKSEIPGRGHASPTVVGDRIYLSTSEMEQDDNGSQSVIALDANSGRIVWQNELFSGELPARIHQKNTHASPTVGASDAGLFVTYYREGSVYLHCLDRSDGKPSWGVRCGPFASKYPFGYAPSPCLWNDLVLVSAESAPDGFLKAYRQSDGERVWSAPRGDGTSYSSPVIGTLGGREQILLSGHLRVDSYDPSSGSKLWTAPGPANATCGTLVWSEDAGIVFASGGYPQKATFAVNPTGEIVWQNKEKSYEQSMLYHDGHLYSFTDAGFALCWDAKTGEEKWKERLKGPVSASPILAGGRIYALNERGTTFVIAPNPDRFEILATNQLGEEGFATPSFVGKRIYHRTAEEIDGRRVEFLYAIEAAR